MLRLLLSFVIALFGVVESSQAQVQRVFPQNALRGAIVIGEAPQITLNGRPTQLSPGGRIRDASNLSVVPGTLIGGRFLVHYTTDLGGYVKDVWILRPEEAAKRWPTSLEEAQKWSFDPVEQVWTRP